MSRRNDIAGQRFGSLTAIAPVLQSKNGTWKWKVDCDCGNSEVVFITALNSGNKVCCKECRKKIWAEERTTHGYHNSPTYRSWRSMKARCQNENHDAYSRYGGRGITVDSTWGDFERFLADMGERPAGHTLDRENNDGPYCKSNCRWATYKEQANNRRNNRKKA